jgi:hypothetical protein
MGSIVAVYTGPPNARKLEGAAEVTEVLRYKGNGRYVVRCVFVDDPKKRLRWREIKIDESVGPQKGDLS